jgi:site-specific DNA-methyltransferase (adenine-specific)
MSSIDIRQGDARSVLADVIPDVMIVDPPYSKRVHATATSCGTPGARASKAMKGAAHRDLGFDYITPELRNFICVVAARTKRWSVIYSDVESVGLWKDRLEAAGAEYIRAMPWVRWSMPQLSGDRPPQGHEMVVVAWGTQGGRKSWNGPGNLTHLAHTCMRGDDKHKAQKPLDQLLDLVEYFSNPAELVCDPLIGSGTTALACALLGRKCVGSELDPDWAAKAKLRASGASFYDDEERYARYKVAAALRVKDMERMAANTARIVKNRAAQEARDAAEASNGYERTPEGTINNCSLANLAVEGECQICCGACPDRARFADRRHLFVGSSAVESTP